MNNGSGSPTLSPAFQALKLAAAPRLTNVSLVRGSFLRSAEDLGTL